MAATIPYRRAVMVTSDEARRLALELPDAVEQDHHGRPSFRVGGGIFATLWTPSALNVMAGEERIHAAAEEWPDVCSKVFWGRRLSAVQIDLDAADCDLVADLLEAAWQRRRR